MESMHDLVSRLLEERYSKGYNDGYARARSELEAILEERAGNGVTPTVDQTDSPPADAKAPYAQRILAFLREHPGSTAHYAATALGGSTSVVYRLAERGLVEKRGAQFFAIDG